MSVTNRQLLMFGFALWVVMSVVKLKAWTRHGRAEKTLDGALDETFPASDPTATQDYAIPVNRV